MEEDVDTVSEERSYSLREAAERLGVAARSARRYVQSGQLEAFQAVGLHGPEWRITEAALASYEARVARVKRDTVSHRYAPVATSTLSIVASQLDAERAATQAAWLRAEAAWQRVAELEAEVGRLRALLPAPRRSVLDRFRGRSGGGL